MGGHVFVDTAPLSSEDVERVKVSIPSLIGNLGISNFTYVGSTIDPGPANDIDIVIDSGSNLVSEKSRIYLAASTILGSRNVKRVGSILSLRYPVENRKEPCQIDLIPCKNLRNASWLMRGLFRHMLFALLAKEQSESISEKGYDAKVTVIAPDGIQIVLNGTVILERTNDPSTILSYLGFDEESIKPSMVADLKGLVSIVAHERKHILRTYEEYVSHLKDKKGYDEAIAIVRDALL